MKALNLKEYKQFEFIDVPMPELEADEVLIQVKATGICGSDVHGMDGSSGRRIPPVVMGHESAGVISQIGGAVTQWQIGDRVTFDSTISCGQCEFCGRGQANLCDNRRVFGVSCDEYNQAGAFAEFVKVPDRILYRIPDSMTFQQAAFCEPVAVALHAVSRVPVSSGDTAVVVGTGIIGLLVVQALKAAGCEKVIAVDLDPFKLETAKKVGADETLISGPETLHQIMEMTGGRGVDIAMEVVGITPTTNMAIGMLRKGGSLVCVGNIAQKIEFPLQAVVTRELTVYGTCAINNEYPEAIELISSGKIQVDPIISKVAPLSEGADWFAKLHENKDNLLKVILEP
ncbi:L-iditol 2-dehydrogenase [Neorhodopirellula lusitana]|uniref:L-iditol 2-dehydrogenase n=1 Tax=Neorhodopirellula lusitana TaxID=445327 RepID=A0ABY1PR04_9BACT|nr:galactitol-1-phosphate 5-dehydrogenase [Neorhodopirellula lusitana]SMP42897.1 L-iditol 2-dehydrogenase [Neorhodopirellula lusitana]